MPQPVAPVPVQRTSDSRQMLTFELYPFRLRDPLVGKWIRARHKMQVPELQRAYSEWEITGAAEIRHVTGLSARPCNPALSIACRRGRRRRASQTRPGSAELAAGRRSAMEYEFRSAHCELMPPQAWLTAITDQLRAERLEQRPQPFAVEAPAPDRALIDGTVHFRCARSFDRTLHAMKVETRFVPV